MVCFAIHFTVSYIFPLHLFNLAVERLCSYCYWMSIFSCAQWINKMFNICLPLEWPILFNILQRMLLFLVNKLNNVDWIISMNDRIFNIWGLVLFNWMHRNIMIIFFAEISVCDWLFKLVSLECDIEPEPGSWLWEKATFVCLIWNCWW